MIGVRTKVFLAGALLLSLSASAQAFGWRWGRPAYQASYYYHPYVPVYYSYPICTTIVPVVGIPHMPPATKTGPVQTPVPQTKEPPAAANTDTPPLANPIRKAPTVTEARSMSSNLIQASNTKERCKVGFWNLTGRDITLKIDGQPRTLAKDRAITLELDRAFAWQIDDGASVNERVPTEQPFHEVILRQ